jgi:YidC/Oxa1 family membrane protein insertase
MLSYQAHAPQVTVLKKFIINHEVHKIDMILDIVPAKEVVFDFVRIVWPSPVMSDNVAYNVISSIAINNKDFFEKKAAANLDMQQGWFAPKLFGSDNKYFAHVLLDYSDGAVARSYYKQADAHQLLSIIELPTINQPVSFEYSFYFGPKELEAMNAVDSRLEQTLDFSGIFSPIAKLMLKLLKWLHNYLKNFGLAIIALTMLIRLFMLPITFRGEKSMREFQKKSSSTNARMNYLKQKHKNNPEELQRAQAELIKEQGISGLGGCLLPMLVQVPMFFALRNVLNSSLEMYQAPFLWISDLSASDPLYLLPLFAAVTMGIQMMQNPDPKQRINSGKYSAWIVAVVCRKVIFKVREYND